MSNSEQVFIAGDESCGHSAKWWSDTRKMLLNGYKLFCEKRGLDPSEGVEPIDVRIRRRRRRDEEEEL